MVDLLIANDKSIEKDKVVGGLRVENAMISKRSEESQTTRKPFETAIKKSKKIIPSTEKPFQCVSCAKYFRFGSSLTRHIKLHTGEKAYSCETCGKNFRALDTLKDHNRIHTGEKPFQCPICGKKSTQRSNLKTHIKTHFDKTSS